MAPDAHTWKQILRSIGNRQSEDSRRSLRELFLLFLEDRLKDFGQELNVMDMRLLLHPLHALVSNASQIGFSLNTRSKRAANMRSRFRLSHSQAFDEIHSLLNRWLAVFETIDIQGARLAVVARATLIQYHLISISLLVSFKTLEAFARREKPEVVAEFACSIQEDLVKYHPELLLHCGQILRLIQDTDVKLRPPWWSAAVYRATLALWVYSITRKYVLQRVAQHHLTPSGPQVALDAAMGLLDPTLSRYVLSGVGRPYFTASTEQASIVYIDNPRQVLQASIEAFGRGLRLWRLTRGLQCQMEKLYRDWEDAHSELEK